MIWEFLCTSATLRMPSVVDHTCLKLSIEEILLFLRTAGCSGFRRQFRRLLLWLQCNGSDRLEGRGRHILQCVHVHYWVEKKQCSSPPLWSIQQEVWYWGWGLFPPHNRQVSRGPAQNSHLAGLLWHIPFMVSFRYVLITIFTAALYKSLVLNAFQFISVQFFFLNSILRFQPFYSQPSHTFISSVTWFVVVSNFLPF